MNWCASFLFNRYKQVFFGLCLFVLLIQSCSKGNGDIAVPVQPPVTPGNNTPTGIIQNFTISDSLLAFGYSTTLKWLVNGTNTYTVVSINGVKVGIYGVLDTGPLKQDTRYILSLNNGQQASITVKVYDSLSTALWNQGRGLKQTQAQMYLQLQGQTAPAWVDTTLSQEEKLRRIYFQYNGGSTIIRTGASTGLPVIDGSRFTTDIAAAKFTWGSVTYTIESLTSLSLTVRFPELQPNGTYVAKRNHYVYE